MTTPDFIVGRKTCSDWQELRVRLTSPRSTHADWDEAYDDYFLARLQLRYLNPISVLQQNGTFAGEGFSIAAIQCSLVEFLESTWAVTRYRFTRRQDLLGPYEYNSSSSVFVSFLSGRTPFSSEFDTDIARDFYEGVRCGLLHEAATKNGWRIWAEGAKGRIIDAENKLLFRNGFQSALNTFVDDYREALTSNPDRQTAFVRKYDFLCAAT